MDSEDLYPNDSTYFDPFKEPIDQTIERKKERAQTLEAMNILKDHIKRLEARIAFYELNSSIPDEVRAEPDKFVIMSNSHMLTAKCLQSEVDYLGGLIDSYKR